MKLLATFDDLRPGDVLLKVDGLRITNREPVTVERAARGRDRLELVKPHLVTTDHLLYRDFGREYEIERPITVARKATDSDRTLALLAEAVQIPAIRDYVPGEHIGDGRDVLRAPGGRTPDASPPERGDVVLAPIGHHWRPAVVIEVGRKRVRVAYATPNGVTNARRYGNGLAVMRPQVSLAEVYTVTGEEWAQAAIAQA